MVLLNTQNNNWKHMLKLMDKKIFETLRSKVLFYTLKASITTEADDKFCNIFPSF